MDKQRPPYILLWVFLTILAGLVMLFKWANDEDERTINVDPGVVVKMNPER